MKAAVSFQAIAFRWPTLLLITWLPAVALAQPRCAERVPFTPVSVPNRVEWSKFPAFSLPGSFTLIYGGPRLDGDTGGPLSHGSTHLTQPRQAENVQRGQRALEYSGFVYGLNQPWETLESPWGNDLGLYRAKWTAWLREQSGGQTNAAGQFVLPADILMVDLERVLETDAAILRLKQNTATPTAYRSLSDTDFLRQYKKDMTALYALGLQFLREKADLTRTKLSTYSDVPIRNAYANVVANAWTDWTTNPARLNFLTADSTGLRSGGPFYNQLDFLSPSSYYYYDYPNPLAPDFLAYSLFQVEANRAWSQKPVIPFVWMRFHDCCGNNPNFIPANMAEATAIFPFFSGAKGLWFWDQLNLATTRQDVHAAYEHFIHGLYRLSQFNGQFAGNYELVIETPARDLMDARKPVWRGVFNQNKLLVAAHNPYATDGQTTTLPISYKSWQGSITLTGREIALCQYDLSLLTTETPTLPDLNIYPNPARNEIIVETKQSDPVALIDIQGRILRQIPNISGPLRLDISTLPAGLYLIRSGGVTKQIIVE
ncbi:T9SS type A sorting domain-containing protein [Fibrella aquatilis]|uniref:T9SS type A sorting domain-containing protein n=1 Tax=Fibrella aquatilis TaxID=2817059 RepID=A0A939JYX5_9BACT|nr:T9SS type A sorting domain-containing protein [Fibrella aquatilis]MBO0930326.1 T9SS type A sorting domain-containing protein [Fibrella aquatilis]